MDSMEIGPVISPKNSGDEERGSKRKDVRMHRKLWVVVAY